MSMTRWRILVLMTMLATLASCGSTPSANYYLLSADAPPAAGADGPTLGIAELHVAEYLRRPELVLLRSPNRLELQEFERWAEPLEDGIERTLALNLGALLATDAVRTRPWPRSWTPQWELRCTIARLDVGSTQVELVATWSLQATTGAAVLIERNSRISVARSGSAADSVAADISTVLLQLSEQLSAAIQTATPAANAAVAAIH